MAPNMSLMKLCKEMETPIQLREFLFIQNMLPPSKNCPECESPMTLNYNNSRAVIGDFRCQKKSRHQDKKSIKISQSTGTWFMGSHLEVEKILILTYAFAHKFTYEQAINECNLSDEDTLVSKETVANWFNYCREICVIALDTEYQDEGLIGGDGHIVEIDEMKLGRRKHHRGRIVEGSWIFGLIDRDTKDFRLEICPANKRDERTLLKLIKKHVEPAGTEINSDGWGGYINLEKHGFKHNVVNHSNEFVASDYTHTNTIESQWRPLRKRLARGGIRKEQLADHLCEFLWHREQKKFRRDPFLSLCKTISEVTHNNPT